VLPADAFAAALAPALAAGATLAGGCCGGTGEHLRALAAAWRAIT
jgi:methionine synthase I (cobalamin-dependent)